jgi:hypothetical protein
MPSTYTLISSNVLASAAASVTFSSIPSTYTDLVLKINGRGSSAAQSAEPTRITINSSSATDYSYIMMANAGGSANTLSQNALPFLPIFRDIPATTATANTFGNTEVYIPNYALSTVKPISMVAAPEEAANGSYYNIAAAGLWNSASAITSLTLVPSVSTNFVANSSFYLYGIKNS